MSFNIDFLLGLEIHSHMIIINAVIISDNKPLLLFLRSHRRGRMMGNDGEEQDEVHNMINLLDKRCVRSGDKKIPLAPLANISYLYNMLCPL